MVLFGFLSIFLKTKLSMLDITGVAEAEGPGEDQEEASGEVQEEDLAGSVWVPEAGAA